MEIYLSATLTIYNTVILVISVIKFLDRNFLFIEKVQAFLDLGENLRDIEKIKVQNFKARRAE